MSDKARGIRAYTALVTFTRSDLPNDILPDEAEGACGYMAVLAEDHDSAVQNLRASLHEKKLIVSEVEDIEPFDVQNPPHDLDEHLAQNILRWQDGRSTVWGTLHVFLAEGEA